MATAFDTMWAVMLALKEASAVLPPDESLEYNVKNLLGSSRVTRTIESKLRDVSFEGLTVIRLSSLFLYFSGFLSC